jgi:hypothetical protein
MLPGAAFGSPFPAHVLPAEARLPENPNLAFSRSVEAFNWHLTNQPVIILPRMGIEKKAGWGYY